MRTRKVNSPNFTSVIPTRVIKNGQDITDSKEFQKGCHELIQILAGPIKDNNNYKTIAKKFAQVDKDYNYSTALIGFKQKVFIYGKAIQKSASDFFKLINFNGLFLMLTGKQAEALAKAGKQIGIAKALAKDKNVETLQLYEAKKTYAELIKFFGTNKAFRVKEDYDPATRQLLGDETILHVFLGNNYKPENIEFIPYRNQ